MQSRRVHQCSSRSHNQVHFIPKIRHAFGAFPNRGVQNQVSFLQSSSPQHFGAETGAFCMTARAVVPGGLSLDNRWVIPTSLSCSSSPCIQGTAPVSSCSGRPIDARTKGSSFLSSEKGLGDSSVHIQRKRKSIIIC